MTASHLTVRNLPGELAAALEKEKRRRRTSLNQTVIDLLRQSLGVSPSTTCTAATAPPGLPVNGPRRSTRSFSPQCRSFKRSIGNSGSEPYCLDTVAYSHFKRGEERTTQIFGQRRMDRRSVPVNDVWIAATCARTAATLLTWDGHFLSIPRVGTIVLE